MIAPLLAAVPPLVPDVRSRPALRRLVMQIDLRSTPLPVAVLPLQFGWEPWRDDRTASHATVLYEGFRGTVDAAYMRALSTLEGCHDLMTATSHHQFFVEEATWLSLYQPPGAVPLPVGTIQVIGSLSRAARIQNLTVLPEFRGRGIARATLIRSLRSCRALGYELVELEVTALNSPAVELYRQVGFTLRRAYLHVADGG